MRINEEDYNNRPKTVFDVGVGVKAEGKREKLKLPWKLVAAEREWVLKFFFSVLQPEQNLFYKLHIYLYEFDFCYQILIFFFTFMTFKHY